MPRKILLGFPLSVSDDFVASDSAAEDDQRSGSRAEAPSYILVDGSENLAQHYVVDADPGHLAEDSGAKWAYELFLTSWQGQRNRYLAFDPKPRSGPNAAPAHLGYTGKSDGAACALALLPPEDASAPSDRPTTVLVSCRLIQDYRAQGIAGVRLGRVTGAEQPGPGLASLKSKWRAAQAASSAEPAVLVLHSDDAHLLSQANGTEVSTLEQMWHRLSRGQKGDVVLVGVGTEDLPDLALALGRDPKILRRRQPRVVPDTLGRDPTILRRRSHQTEGVLFEVPDESPELGRRAGVWSAAVTMSIAAVLLVGAALLIDGDRINQSLSDGPRDNATHPCRRAAEDCVFGDIVADDVSVAIEDPVSFDLQAINGAGVHEATLGATRYRVAEEGLRLLEFVPGSDAGCLLLRTAPGELGYSLSVTPIGGTLKARLVTSRSEEVEASGRISLYFKNGDSMDLFLRSSRVRLGRVQGPESCIHSRKAKSVKVVRGRLVFR